MGRDPGGREFVFYFVRGYGLKTYDGAFAVSRLRIWVSRLHGSMAVCVWVLSVGGVKQ